MSRFLIYFETIGQAILIITGLIAGYYATGAFVMLFALGSGTQPFVYHPVFPHPYFVVYLGSISLLFAASAWVLNKRRKISKSYIIIALSIGVGIFLLDPQLYQSWSEPPM